MFVRPSPPIGPGSPTRYTSGPVDLVTSSDWLATSARKTAITRYRRGLRPRETFPPHAVHPLAGADSPAGLGGVSFRVPDAAARHLQHPLCAAGVHRVTRVGGYPPPAGRHHMRRPGDPVLEIPQEPPRPTFAERRGDMLIAPTATWVRLPPSADTERTSYNLPARTKHTPRC